MEVARRHQLACPIIEARNPGAPRARRLPRASPLTPQTVAQARHRLRPPRPRGGALLQPALPIRAPVNLLHKFFDGGKRPARPHRRHDFALQQQSLLQPRREPRDVIVSRPHKISLRRIASRRRQKLRQPRLRRRPRGLKSNQVTHALTQPRPSLRATRRHSFAPKPVVGLRKQPDSVLVLPP